MPVSTISFWRAIGCAIGRKDLFRDPGPFRQKEWVLSGRISLVSSAIALRARAEAVPMPVPARGFAKLLLLGGATLAVIGAMHQLRHFSPVEPSPQPMMSRALNKDVMAAPAKPSVFAQEAAMSSSELIQRWDPLIVQASKKFKVPAE